MIDVENKRRSTLTQLNRGEGRHSLGRAIFNGKRGELRRALSGDTGGSARCAGPRCKHDRPVEHNLRGGCAQPTALGGTRGLGGGCRQTFSAYPRPHQRAGPVFLRDAGNGNLTHAGFVGTPAFASPEQFTGASVDVKSC